MEFVIYLESEHIFDPDTGEDLGPIEMVKGRVKVHHVMERMSRGRTLTYQIPTPSSYEQTLLGISRISRFLQPALGPTYEIRRHKLEVDEDQVMPLQEDLVVRIGDKVRSV